MIFRHIFKCIFLWHIHLKLYWRKEKKNNTVVYITEREAQTNKDRSCPHSNMIDIRNFSFWSTAPYSVICYPSWYLYTSLHPITLLENKKRNKTTTPQKKPNNQPKQNTKQNKKNTNPTLPQSFMDPTNSFKRSII